MAAMAAMAGGSACIGMLRAVSARLPLCTFALSLFYVVFVRMACGWVV